MTTTATLTQSTCATILDATILGCKVKDDDWETPTTLNCSRTTITTDRPGNNAAGAEACTCQSGDDRLNSDARAGLFLHVFLACFPSRLQLLCLA